jgi:hypothetical protein
MPSKKTLDYDPYEDDDDDEDEFDGLFKGMKLKANEGRHTFKTPAGNREFARLRRVLEAPLVT